MTTDLATDPQFHHFPHLIAHDCEAAHAIASSLLDTKANNTRQCNAST